MRCYELGEPADPPALRRVERDLSVPRRGEALVRVRAAGLNYRDLLIAAGRYHGPKPAARIPLGDGAGEVVAVGEAVTSVAIGDRVTAVHFVPWRDGAFDPTHYAQDLGATMDGWLADHILLPAGALVPIPDALSFAEAAALPAAGVTAWRAVVEIGGVRPGDTVLTYGTGGVSMAAAQIARMAGARVVMLSSSDTKLAIAAQAGVDIGINYTATPDWTAAVRKAVPRGADIIVETLGIANLDRSLACAAPNARICLIGALAGRDQTTGLAGLIATNASIHGIASGSRRMLVSLLGAYADNGVRPVIDRIFGFDEAVEAYGWLKQGGHVGKILIRP